MHKSQLRRLALNRAQGRIADEEFRQQRQLLIDGVVDGALAIERELPPPRIQPDEPTDASAAAVLPHPRPPSPIAVVVGIAVLALVGWVLWPASKPPPAPVVAPPSPAPVHQISAARTLVESFLAVRDWSAASVARFRRDWNGLSPGEQEQARSAAWFRRLTKAMRDELKTQKALAEFNRTGAAAETGARLLKLGAYLGVSESLPTFELPARAPEPAPAPSPPETPQAAPASEPASSIPGDEPPAGAPEKTLPRVTGGAAGIPAQEDSSSAWLTARRPDRYTLQLFAVNRLDRVERIMATNPDLPLRLVEFEGRTPRYRVLFGDYDTRDGARLAYASLPSALRSEQPTLYVKSFAEIAAAAGTSPVPASPVPASPVPASPAARPEDWLSKQDRRHFTLQLFASDSRANADRLVTEHPALELKLYTTTVAGARYRVLYGIYSSREAARQSRGALPPAVLRAAGKPLVKSVDELTAIAARGG